MSQKEIPHYLHGLQKFNRLISLSLFTVCLTVLSFVAAGMVAQSV